MNLNSNVPYYIQVASILRNEIQRGVFPGESKLPGEGELAARFKVSKDVVRVSLRQLADEGLLCRIRSKGTFVRHNPTQNVTRVLLTVCQNPVAVELLRCGVEQGIGDRKMDLILKRIPPCDLQLEQECLELISPADFGAMVVTPAVSLEDDDNRAIYANYLKRGLPVIFVDHELTGIGGDSVFFDEYGGAYDMTLETFTRNSGPFAVCLSHSPHRIIRQRIAGFTDAAHKCGIPEKSHFFFDLSVLLPGTAIAESFFRQIQTSKLEPVNLIVYNNIVAWELFKLLRDAKLTRKLHRICAIGDGGCGDEEFNSLLVCRYRLYDDFIEPVSEILSYRLAGRIPAGTSTVKMIRLKSMTHAEINNYFTNVLSNQFQSHS